ncbi:MAG: glycosyltransferase [Alphaproteobacteria bacterium]|nr:glycosyltransferase [Alphaproteobacteria bacterium]
MKKDGPKISVIVPVYNTEPDFLDAALNSLFNQTMSDLEIIVVDDGSSNKDTLKYLNRIKSDSRIKFIRQKNMGQSVARNSALDIATGDYIGFLDSDDWLDNDFYETLYKQCETNDSDVACGVLRIVEKFNTHSIDKHPTCVINDLSSALSYITNGSVCSKLFKHKLFQNIRFPSGLYYEDNLTLLELLFGAKSVSFNNMVFYHYRSNPNSTVHDNKRHEKRVRDSIEILSKINQLSKSRNSNERDAINRTFLNILFVQSEYLTNKKYREDLERIFGKRYLESFLPIPSQKTFLGRIINKIKRFVFRTQNGRVKIFKITVYKIKG